MRITLDSTAQTVMLETGQGAVPARIWQGATGDGTPCFAFITMIAPAIPIADEAGQAKFADQLDDATPLWPSVEAWLMGQHFGRPQ